MEAGMTDYERKRRDECIKLRDQVERLKREASTLETQRDGYSKALTQALLTANVWKEAHAQLCQGLGKKP
jgi:uncharacterized protein YlxW (UPF0749 family)